jgi:hypothetical protein
MQAQLTVQLQAAADGVGGGTAGGGGGSGWDGPCVCSCSWALVQLGGTLQPSTLHTAEQYLVLLMPQGEQEHLQAHRGGSSSSGSRLAPPLAADLAVFGAACRACSYQPQQLLQQLRTWLLLQLAKHGPSALRKLARPPAAAAAKRLQLQVQQADAARGAAGSAPPAAVERQRGDQAAASGSGSSNRGSLEQQQQQPSQHTDTLVNIMLLLRCTGFCEPMLLERLAFAAAVPPVRQQLSAQQLVMLLTSFRSLGFFPSYWAKKSLLADVTRHVRAANAQLEAACSSSSSSQDGEDAGAADSSIGSSGGGSSGSHSPGLTARDCVELLECFAAWQQHATIDNAGLRQHVLPGLAQLLLGAPAQRQRRAAAAAPQQADGASSAAGSSEEGDRGLATTSSSTSSGSSGAALVPLLSGPQTLAALRSIVQLQYDNRPLQQALLRQLQATWGELSASAQVAAAHAAARLHCDLTAQLDLQQLLPELCQQPDQQQVQGSGSSTGGSDGDAESDWVFSTTSAAARLLWTFANFGKHPGPLLLDAALSTIAAAADSNGSGSSSGVSRLPLREVSNALYSAAVLQEQQHPVALSLLRSLVAAADAGQLAADPQFVQQSEQLAACMLAAQAAAGAAAGGLPADQQQPPAAAAGALPSSVDATSSSSSSGDPWLCLPVSLQQPLLQAWRRKTVKRAARQQRRPYLEQKQLLLCLRQLGLRAKANALTEDGCLCIDVAAMTPRGE